MNRYHLSTSFFAAWLSALATAQVVDVPPGFTPGVKWQIDIQHALDTSAPLVPTDAPVWDLDLYFISRNPGTIDYLRRQNPDVFIICYFNAGAVQESDCDWDEVWQKPPYIGLLGNPLGDFPDERWVNIKNQTGRDLIKKRITVANELGCDGVDPDNIDGYLVDEDDELPAQNKTGWNLSEQDELTFVKELAAHAHNLTTRRGFTMLIGQKNAAPLAEQLVGDLDFAVLEDCKGLNEDPEDDPNFCQEFQRYVNANPPKPVFSIEYPPTLGNPATGACNASGANQQNYTASCTPRPETQGFSTVLKIQGDQGELNGCTQYCDGFGRGVVVTVEDARKDENNCTAGTL
ncbi:hypothetical protein OQA88_5411 [Cercophora sp. LCS_1]